MSFTIANPQNNARFPLGEAVEFNGTADADIARVELTTDNQFTFPAVTLINGEWSVANRFNLGGVRRVTARAFDASDTQIATAEVAIQVEVPDFGSLVRIPSNINNGVTKARQQTMIDIFGSPGALSEDCTSPASPSVTRLLVTQSVGPFRVTGIRPAVEALTRIFAKVNQNLPALISQLGTAGMTCCRRIRTIPGRPPSRQFSNHSWGSAVDIKIRGTLDPRGDGRTQLGLLLLHPFFNAEKFFWGAGFGGEFEDSMHFEASDELVRQWKRDGVLDA
jgi:D-alanyl-D-alanine carboxypeptidase